MTDAPERIWIHVRYSEGDLVTGDFTNARDLMPNVDPKEYVRYDDHCALITAKDARIAELEAALTPSAETKTAYMDEFSVGLPVFDEYGYEYTRKVNVPWVVIKEIMAAILAHAGKPNGGEND